MDIKENIITNLFNITNHEITESQKQDAEKNFKTTRYIDLPDELKDVWAQVPADPRLKLNEYLYFICKFLDSRAKYQDIVMVQGEHTCTMYIVDFCRNRGLYAVAAISERKSEEYTDENGDIQKKSVFSHAGFRNYQEF